MNKELEYMAKAMESVAKFTDMIADKVHAKTFVDIERWMDYQKAYHERFEQTYIKRLERLETIVETLAKQIKSK